MLSRCLEIDDQSLAKPGGGTFLSGRDSPPPLGDLLETLAERAAPTKSHAIAAMDRDGFWLGRAGSKEGQIWIGENEKKLMRIWAGVVCTSIEGRKMDEVVLGRGGLGWEI